MCNTTLTTNSTTKYDERIMSNYIMMSHVHMTAFVGTILLLTFNELCITDCKEEKFQ